MSPQGLDCLQLKIVYMIKWHILAWPTLGFCTALILYFSGRKFRCTAWVRGQQYWFKSFVIVVLVGWYRHDVEKTLRALGMEATVRKTA